MKINFNNIKTIRFVASILIIVILFIIFISAFIYIKETENEKNNFFEMGKVITNQTSRALEHWIDEQIRFVKIIAKDERIIEACLYPDDKEKVNKAKDFLSKLHKMYPYYENLPISIKLNNSIAVTVNGEDVIIENGDFLIDTVGGKTIGKGGMKYSFVNEIFNGKDYFISEIYPSILRNNPIFVIGAPINYNGNLLGAAIISPQVEYFTEKFVKNIKYGNTGYLFFIDERGLIIAHKNENYILSKIKEFDHTKELNHIIDRIISNEKYFEETYFVNNKHYVSTRVNLDPDHLKYGWYIVFTQNNEEIFASVNSLLNLITILLIIGITFIGLILYVIVKINQKRIYEENLILINKVLETEVEQRTRKLRELAIRDGLTNLYNHNTCYEILEKEVSNSKEKGNNLSAIMLDLDYFKKINDTYGHQVGDEVLKAVSKAIIANIRETDVAGRYGGEEFIIILPNTNKELALVVAKRIKNSVSQIKFDIKELSVTASIGLYTWKGETALQLVSNADKLLYKAKMNGRNRIEA